MNKSILTKLTIDKIISMIALFCVGLCLVIWAEQVTDAIVIALGVILLFFSVASFIRFVAAPSKERSAGSLFFIILGFLLGLLLVMRVDFVKSAISFLVGFYIVLTSAVAIMNIYDIRKKTEIKFSSYFWPIVGLLLGILCVSGQFIVPDQLARLTGVVLIIYAIASIIGFASLSAAIKDAKKTAKIQEGQIVKESTSKAKTTKAKSSKKSSSSKSSKKSKK